MDEVEQDTTGFTPVYVMAQVRTWMRGVRRWFGLMI